MTVDAFGAPVAAASPESVMAWDAAWMDFYHFEGQAFRLLAAANDTDDAFALGSVFCGTYRILGGSAPDSYRVQTDLERARTRSSSDRELSHLDALGHMVDGDFSRAAKRWDSIAAACHDLAAVRFAHDVYLHVGDDHGRLASSSRAAADWPKDAAGGGFVLGQYSFALEEAGDYAAAEDVGWQALERDHRDLWALHALAHVYESTESHTQALDLLRGRMETWSQQPALATHIWWHLALRLIAAGSFDEVLAIHDSLQPETTMPFGLSDLASLLWRLELVGVDVGGRWKPLADAFASRHEQHTVGFLDLHFALVFARCPDHPAAATFFASVLERHAGAAENNETFQNVVKPLTEAIRISGSQPDCALTLLQSIEADTYRIGGSIAQRDLINRTRTALEAHR